MIGLITKKVTRLKCPAIHVLLTEDERYCNHYYNAHLTLKLYIPFFYFLFFDKNLFFIIKKPNIAIPKKKAKHFLYPKKKAYILVRTRYWENFKCILNIKISQLFIFNIFIIIVFLIGITLIDLKFNGLNWRAKEHERVTGFKSSKLTFSRPLTLLYKKTEHVKHSKWLYSFT